MESEPQLTDPGGALGVEPNPAQSGDTVTITAAPGARLSAALSGVGVTMLVVGADGRATFKIPIGFDGTLLVSNEKYPRPESVRVNVVTPGPRPK